MRTAVLGGTRFIGRAVVDEMLAAGHDVVVVHRGEHEPHDLPSVEHLHIDRRELTAGHLAGCDAVIDTSGMTGEDADRALAAIPAGIPMVAVSSIEVYRAYASLLAGRVTDPLPLIEDSPLDASHDKVAVESACLERGGTVCRLPMVYGPHDYKRREGFVLDRLGDGSIPVGGGGFLWSRGYAPEVAHGLRLALEHPGEVFNLCERTCAPIRRWMEEIVEAAGAEVEFVRVPDEKLPEDLEITGDIPQHWMASAEKAERLLSWTHADPQACVQKSVDWHLEALP